MNAELKHAIEHLIKSLEGRPLELCKFLDVKGFDEDPEIARPSLELLAKIKSYEIFNTKTHYFGTMGHTMTYQNLLNWIVERSEKVGVSNALTELNTFVSEDSYDAELIELLIDPGFKLGYTFANGVEFKSTSSIADDKLVKILDEFNSSLSIPYPQIESILSAPFKHPKVFGSSNEFEKFNKIKLPFEKLRITKLLLSLSRDVKHGVHSQSILCISPSCIPIIRSRRWLITNPTPPTSGPEVQLSEFQFTDELLKKFESLEESLKEKLLIPLERLNSFGSGKLHEDRAVDLRMCLESVFLGDGNKEQLKYRVSLRAALFLGEKLVERKRIMKIVKESYDITSTIVHNGIRGRKFDYAKLECCANYVRQALIKIIFHGKVNWENIELGDNIPQDDHS